MTIRLQAADELVLVSPHWEGAQREFDLGFRRYYRDLTGRDVNLRWRDVGGTSQIQKMLDATYKATPASSGVDIFFGGGMDPYVDQKAKGHLHPYPLPSHLLTNLPSTVLGVELIDKDFTYYGAALSSFGIVENRRVVERLNLPPVATWADLAQPELYSWVSSADPRKSGSVHMIYEIILQAHGWQRGWEIIYQFSGNVRSFLQTSSAPTKEVSLGDVAYAISIDINGLTQQAFLGKDNVRFFLPEGASVITPDGIAILKGAPNLAVAEHFMNFTLSPQGQSLWMKPRGHPDGPVRYDIARMGVLPSLYNVPAAKRLVPINPFTRQRNDIEYNSPLGSQRWKVVNDLIGQTIIDIHPHLKRAWSTILELPEPERSQRIALFSQPPVSEAEAADLADVWKNDPLRAAQLRNTWMKEAVARCHRLALPQPLASTP